MNKFDKEIIKKLELYECEIMRISKEYEICRDFYLALGEAAAALNWAQFELKKLDK